jgi:hypothetical protein
VARVGVETEVNKVLVGKPEGKNHLEDQDVDRMMGSEWIVAGLAERCSLDSTGSG